MRLASTVSRLWTPHIAYIPLLLVDRDRSSQLQTTVTHTCVQFVNPCLTHGDVSFLDNVGGGSKWLCMSTLKKPRRTTPSTNTAGRGNNHFFRAASVELRKRASIHLQYGNKPLLRSESINVCRCCGAPIVIL